MSMPASRCQNTAMVQNLRRPTALLVAVTLLLTLLAAAPASAQVEDKALGRPATASSVEQARPGGQCNETICAPGMATDGNPDTRWESEYADTEWWQVDLGRARQVDQVSFVWHVARAEAYVISTSLDGTTFTEAAEVRLDLTAAELANVVETRRHRETTIFPARPARFVRMTSRRRAPIGDRQRVYGVSFWEANVFGPSDDAPVTQAGQPAPSTPARPGAGFDLPSAPTPPSPGSSPSAPPAPPAAPGAAAPERLPLLRPFPVIRIKGSLTRSGAAIQLLSIRAPRAATVRVSCRGRGCPRRVKTRKGGTKRIRELQRALRAGTVIDVAVTQRGRSGKHTRFVIRRGRAPRRTDRCTLGTSTRPVRCPAG